MVFLIIFTLCLEPREEPQETIRLVGQVALSCTHWDPVFASKIDWWEKWYRHDVILYFYRNSFSLCI